MARGGARNRSGPSFDPNSRNSERKGIVLTALPPEGYKGMIPAFPTPPLLDEAGEISALSIRERAIWKNHWKSPQACAWALDEWRWPIIAEMCRVEARVEESSSAALIGQLHRYRDQLGLTPAGLKENGWKIGTQETQTTTATAATGPVRGVVSARDRVLKVAG